MKIFQGFLLLVVVAILWMLPISQAIYDFRTDFRSDTFAVTTSGSTETDVVLFKPVYDDDEETIAIYSDLADDTPMMDTYDPLTREVHITGLADDSTRILTVEYLIDALNLHPAINLFVNLLPGIWILILIAFPVVGMVAILTGRT